MSIFRISFIAFTLGAFSACTSPVEDGDTGAAGSSSKTDSGVDPTPDPDAGTPDPDASVEPNTDGGTTDAGKTDGGKTDAGKTDSGTDGGKTDAAVPPPPAPAPPSGPVEGNPPVELIRPAPVIASSAAGSCTLDFATPWYFHASPYKDAAGSPLPIYAQLRGLPLSGNQPLPMVQATVGPVLTQNTATMTFAFTVSANIEAMAGKHELTLHGYDDLASTTQPDGTNAHDYNVWYDSLMNARCTPQADLAFLKCDSWDPTGDGTWTPRDANNCRLAVTLVQTADGCKFTADGNMKDFGPKAKFVGVANPFDVAC